MAWASRPRLPTTSSRDSVRSTPARPWPTAGPSSLLPILTPAYHTSNTACRRRAFSRSRIVCDLGPTRGPPGPKSWPQGRSGALKRALRVRWPSSPGVAYAVGTPCVWSAVSCPPDLGAPMILRHLVVVRNSVKLIDRSSTRLNEKLQAAASVSFKCPQMVWWSGKRNDPHHGQETYVRAASQQEQQGEHSHVCTSG